MALYVMGSSFLTLNPSNVITGPFPKREIIVRALPGLEGAGRQDLALPGYFSVRPLGDLAAGLSFIVVRQGCY